MKCFGIHTTLICISDRCLLTANKMGFAWCEFLCPLHKSIRRDIFLTLSMCNRTNWLVFEAPLVGAVISNKKTYHTVQRDQAQLLELREGFPRLLVKICL